MNRRIARIALVAVVTAGVCAPLLMQIHANRAAAETPGAETGPAKGAQVTGFPNVPPDKVVLTIGDQKITAAEVNKFFSQLDPASQKQILDSAGGRFELANYMIRVKLMAAAAKEQKLDESPVFRSELEHLLAQSLVYSVTTDEAGNKKFFEDNKSYFDSVHVRHILVAFIGPIETAKLTEPQAKAKGAEFYARLQKGEDFAALARSESDDRGTAPTGGDLGTLFRYQFPPALAADEEVAFKLKDKEFSQPIRTQVGYDIIQVLERKPVEYAQAAQLVARRRIDLTIEQMKKSQKTVIDESFFGNESSRADLPATQPAK